MKTILTRNIESNQVSPRLKRHVQSRVRKRQHVIQGIMECAISCGSLPALVLFMDQAKIFSIPENVETQFFKLYHSDQEEYSILWEYGAAEYRETRLKQVSEDSFVPVAVELVDFPGADLQREREDIYDLKDCAFSRIRQDFTNRDFLKKTEETLKNIFLIFEWQERKNKLVRQDNRVLAAASFLSN